MTNGSLQKLSCCYVKRPRCDPGIRKQPAILLDELLVKNEGARRRSLCRVILVLMTIDLAVQLARTDFEIEISLGFDSQMTAVEHNSVHDDGQRDEADHQEDVDSL